MNWSWKIGNVAGIGIFVHWTFLILPAVIGYSALQQAGPWAALDAVVYVLAIFGCVVLHELGHALTARRFGIGTRDITLLPIGGVARLERMPRRPSQELAVALAGPAVNVVIFAVLFAGLWFLGGPAAVAANPLTGSLPVRLMWANVALVVFNLLPAFPMDGGRVLRALLAVWMPYERATSIASVVGQGMAVLLAVAGIFVPSPMLIFVALFVFIAARAENRSVRTTEAFNKVAVRDLMLRHFHTVAATDRLADVAQTMLFSGQRSFPVVDGGRLVGILGQEQLLGAMASGEGDRLVGDKMRRDFPLLDEYDPLETTFHRMQAGNHRGLPVFGSGRLIGMLPLERLKQGLAMLARHPDLARGNVLDASWNEPSRA